MKIAQILSSRTGSSYKSKDIRNLLVKLRSRIRDGDTLEKELEAVIKDGGTVRYDKDPNINFLQVLWIQTRQMKDALNMMKPTVFQSDKHFKQIHKIINF